MTLFSRCALFALTAALFAGGPAVVRAQEKIGDWTVKYDIKDLTILKIEKNPHASAFDITVQNVAGSPTARAAMHISENSTLYFGGLEPGATRVVAHVNEPEPGEEWVIRVSAVLFGDGVAAADGDPADIEYMRFERLGEVLEYSRCLDLLSALDPAHLGDGPIRSQTMRSVDQPVRPLEAGLASFPDSALKQKVVGAGARAAGWFLDGVQAARQDCHGYLEELLKHPYSRSKPSESARAKYFADLLANRQADLKAYRAVCELDMGTGK